MILIGSGFTEIDGWNSPIQVLVSLPAFEIKDGKRADITREDCHRAFLTLARPLCASVWEDPKVGLSKMIAVFEGTPETSWHLTMAFDFSGVVANFELASAIGEHWPRLFPRPVLRPFAGTDEAIHLLGRTGLFRPDLASA